MGAVQLHGIEAGLLGADACGDEGIDDLEHLVVREGACGRMREPRLLARGAHQDTVGSEGRRALAAGMVDLQAKLGARSVNRIHHGLEAGDLVIRIQEEVAGVTTPRPIHHGADLREHEAAATLATAGIEGRVARAGVAVQLRIVVAHGLEDHAVGHHHPVDGHRLEQPIEHAIPSPCTLFSPAPKIGSRGVGGQRESGGWTYVPGGGHAVCEQLLSACDSRGGER